MRHVEHLETVEPVKNVDAVEPVKKMDAWRPPETVGLGESVKNTEPVKNMELVKNMEPAEIVVLVEPVECRVPVVLLESVVIAVPMMCMVLDVLEMVQSAAASACVQSSLEEAPRPCLPAGYTPECWRSSRSSPPPHPAQSSR